jgi:hypothetical protein
MYNEHARLQAEHIAKGGKHKVVVFAKHAYSDSTHLAQFGTTALWPIYIYSGNISQYKQAKPGLFCANHTAYIPSVQVCH